MMTNCGFQKVWNYFIICWFWTAATGAITHKSLTNDINGEPLLDWLIYWWGVGGRVKTNTWRLICRASPLKSWSSRHVLTIGSKPHQPASSTSSSLPSFLPSSSIMSFIINFISSAQIDSFPNLQRLLWIWGGMISALRIFLPSKSFSAATAPPCSFKRKNQN